MALPKPALCYGEEEAGVLSVHCLALDDAGADEQRSFHFHRKDDAERGGYMAWLEDRYGAGDHAVVIFGRDERLEVTLSVVELWHARYEIEDVNYRADDVENPLCVDEPEYREARSLGARALMSFGSPVDSRGSAVMFTLPLSESATTEEREMVEQYFIHTAQSYHMLLAVGLEDMLPGPAQTESPFRRWQRRGLRQHREHMKQLAPEMERFFAGREMPPEVATSIAACRERS